MNWTPAAIAAGSPAALATASSVWMFFSSSGSNSTMSSIVTTCDTGASSVPIVVAGEAILLAPFRPVSRHARHTAPRQQPPAVVRRRQLHHHEQPPALFELVLNASGNRHLRPNDRQVHDLQPLPGVHRLADIETLFRQPYPVAGQNADRSVPVAAGFGNRSLVRRLQVALNNPLRELVLDAPQVDADRELVEGHVGPLSLFLRHGLTSIQARPRRLYRIESAVRISST